MESWTQLKTVKITLNIFAVYHNMHTVDIFDTTCVLHLPYFVNVVKERPPSLSDLCLQR